MSFHIEMYQVALTYRLDMMEFFKVDSVSLARVVHPVSLLLETVVYQACQDLDLGVGGS